MMPEPSIHRLTFRPPWWACLLALLGCSAGIALGNWQSSRAEEKRSLAASRQPQAVRGEFLPKTLLYLDNKTYRGRAGYHVLQVLRLENGRQVLVNRGWLPGTPDRAQVPAVATPGGLVSLQGVKLDHLPHALEPSGVTRTGIVWQNAERNEVAAWSGLALEPWVFEQHAGPEDGLVRDWPPADDGVAMHLSYALQWYSLAALSAVLFVALNVRRHASPAD
jgi:surfeit locus 1 family protein